MIRLSLSFQKSGNKSAYIKRLCLPKKKYGDAFIQIHINTIMYLK